MQKASAGPFRADCSAIRADRSAIRADRSAIRAYCSAMRAIAAQYGRLQHNEGDCSAIRAIAAHLGKDPAGVESPKGRPANPSNSNQRDRLREIGVHFRMVPVLSAQAERRPPRLQRLRNFRFGERRFTWRPSRTRRSLPASPVARHSESKRHTAAQHTRGLQKQSGT